MMNKTVFEMSDFTVVIPIRVDSIVRLENLLAVTDYLLANFAGIRIIVMEAAKHNNHVLERMLPNFVVHHFVRDLDPVFYRTKYINELVKEVTTPYLGVWDTDVIFPPCQVWEAMNALRSMECDVSFPYDGTFLDTGDIIRQMYIETGDLNALTELKGMMSLLYGEDMRGGAFLANTRKYREAGMENLNFYGWGPEDWERVERWKAFGYKLRTVPGNLYHLSHPRDLNGRHNSDDQRRVSIYQKDITCFSSAEEIRQHLNLKY